MLLNKIAVSMMTISFLAFGQEKSADEQKLSVHDKRVQLELQKIQLEKQIKALKNSEKKAQSEDEREAEKRATKGEEKEKRDAVNTEKHAAKTLRNADIEGCSGGVIVSDWATGGWSFQAYAKMRVINTSGVSVDIVDTYSGRTAVRNLCAGGSITLFRAIDFVRDSNTVTFQYVATGKFPDGNVGTSQSPSVYLSQYQTSYQNGQSQIWQIQLQKFISQK